mgnify:CR=1 FL=1
MAGKSAKVAAIVLAVFAVISLVFGAVFIYQGVNANKMLVDLLAFEKVKYEAPDAKGAISGVIDTREETVAMSRILKEHRIANYGFYAELKRDDPKRVEILKAITMGNSLNLATLGFGVATVIIVTGVFMIVMALALGTVAFVIRPRLN